VTTDTTNAAFSITGLNHLGLVVEDMAKARAWFVEALRLPVVEDRGELLFIMVGRDVLALKTPRMAVAKPEHGGEAAYDSAPKAGWQTLDHYGFFAATPAEVDAFAAHAVQHGATILKGPYDRRDGRSVYFRDPCGNVGEYLFFRP
jgi:catechol 2,3-dioxygenase-like lactoylglutathione lyase family enzyme